MNVQKGKEHRAASMERSQALSKKKGLLAQSYLTLCDSMDCSLPGSSVHENVQARILEWVAMPFSRGSSHPRIELGSPTPRVDSLPSEPPPRK